MRELATFERRKDEQFPTTCFQASSVLCTVHTMPLFSDIIHGRQTTGTHGRTKKEPRSMPTAQVNLANSCLVLQHAAQSMRHLAGIGGLAKLLLAVPPDLN